MMATINTKAQREIVGAVTAMGGQVIPAYGGSGRARLLRLEEMKIELDQLEESRRVAQVEMDGFLAIARPGPDVVPGLSQLIEWLCIYPAPPAPARLLIELYRSAGQLAARSSVNQNSSLSRSDRSLARVPNFNSSIPRLIIRLSVGRRCWLVILPSSPSATDSDSQAV
jgi:hypothetical protein